MDDNGQEFKMTDDMVFRMTPKGIFMEAIMRFGANKAEAENEWLLFEGFCIRQSNDPEAPYAALVFDGEGGCVIGVVPAEDSP